MAATFRAAIGGINYLDQEGVEITATAEAPLMPASDVAVPELGLAWRADNLQSSGGTATLTAVFNTARDFSNCAFAFVMPERRDDARDIDFTPAIGMADTVRWQLGSDADTAGDVYDQSFASNVNPQLGFHCPDTLPIQVVPPALRLDMSVTLASVPASPEDVFDIGRVWVGPIHQFLLNHKWGAPFRWTRDELRHRVREWRPDFPAVRDSERDTLETIQQYVTDEHQVIYFPRLSVPATGFIGRFTDQGSFAKGRFNATQWPFALREDWLGF